MQARFVVAAVVGLVGPTSCALALGLDDYEDERLCSGVEDCAPVGDCAVSRCTQRRCEVELLPRYTPCDEPDGEVCNGSGRCVLDDGRACDDEGSCASGYCVDGVCCSVACDTSCMQCIDEPGVCGPVTAGQSGGLDCDAPSVCDGVGICVDGAAVGAASFGGVGADTAHGVAVTDDGGAVITGRIGGDVVFDGESFTFGGVNEDAFTAKYNATGAPVWIDVVPGGTDTRGQAVVAVPGGPVVVGGSFLSEITLAGQLETGSATFYTPYLVALGAGNGLALWGRSYLDTSAGTTASGEILALAVDGTDVIAAGYIGAATDFGDGSGPLGGNGEPDGMLLRIDSSTGDASAALALGGPGFDVVRGVTVDADGDLLVVGSSTQAVDLGGGPLPHSGDAFNDPFVAKLAADGAHRWSRGFTALGNHAFFRGVSSDANGDVYVAGYTHAPLTIEAEVVPVPGVIEGVLVKLDGASGAVLWTRSLGANPYGYCNSVAVDDSGHLLVAGAAEGQASFGAAEVRSMVGVREAFVAAYTRDGELLYVRGLGAAEATQDGIHVSHREGKVALAGFFAGSLSAAGETFPSLGDRDTFVHLLAQ